MSPHAVLPPILDETTQHSHLNKFFITENGFLPATLPLKRLPDSYYAPWECIVHHLPSLLQSGKLHDQVRNLPVLSTCRLKSGAERRRAYVVLTFLMHAWVWGGEKPQQILPPAISVPLLRVSSHLELPPVATYASLNLWNYTTTDPASDLTDLDRLEALHTFTGTRDEAWFYLVSVAMEAEGGRVVSSMLDALERIRTRDYDAVTASLESLAGHIRKTGALLERMYEGCDPMVFFYQIRPFLAGSKNMEAAGLPRGVFYDQGNGDGQWRQLRGGSNGQSSLIQFLDIVLGVEHASNGEGARGSGDGAVGKPREPGFHEQVREYMPGPHRRFLEYVPKLGSIRELASLPARSPEHERLREAYRTATSALTEFRNKHLQIVARYIVLPSKKGKPASFSSAQTQAQAQAQTQTQTPNHHTNRRVDLASASGPTKDSAELTGTGGTALMPFLKQTRDETLQAGDLNGRE